MKFFSTRNSNNVVGFKKAIQSSSGGTFKSKDENRLVLKNN